MAIKSTMIIPAVVAMYGENGGNKLEKRIIIKTDSIPEASKKTFGKIYCYSGETNSTYTHGYIYECVENEPTYSLTDIDFNPDALLVFDYEGGTDPEYPVGTWTSNAEAMQAFLTLVLKNTSHSYYEAAEVDLTIDLSTLIGTHAMWYVAVKDKNGNTLVDNYHVYDTDLAYHGYIFLYPQASYTTDPISNTFQWIKDETGYHFERIDVQPGVKADDFNTPLSPTNKGASMADLEDVKTSDLTFKGYISTTEPSSSTYNLVTGNLWYNSATLPTTLPIPAASLKVWNGSAWENATDSYMPDDLDAWKDLNDGETYVYFAGEWQDYAPQLSPNYFYLNTGTGKWEIKSNVNLPGYPTVSNAPTTDMGIATKAYVDAIAGDFKRGLYDNGVNVSTSSTTVISLQSTITVYTIKPSQDTTLSFSTSNLDIPQDALITFFLIVDFSDGVYNITWPNTTVWGNITPTMMANSKYMFSFTKPYNENVWIANQMYSW